ncbi:MAG: penicillin binding protein PBP4B [Clostridiales bacterium]|jgi:CubicO group peptidase (beta-lactamase class C family)|nr:penicillin binding protein PBP4B [Clostridiales bacterium]
MKRKLLAKGAAWTLVFTSILGNTTLYAKEEVVGNGQITQRTLPERGSSASTIINNRESFKAYKGQGTLYLTFNQVAHAKLYINGKEVDISKFIDPHSNQTVAIDISALVQNGDNTLQVSEIEPYGATIEVNMAYPTLREGTPESVGVDSKVFEVIDRILEAEIEAGGIPGGQLLVAKDGVIIKNEAYGVIKAYDHSGKVEHSIPVTKDTLYDLASNTKMYATNYAVQKLVSEGKLDIDMKISEVIPGFVQFDEKKEQLTLRHLLTHTAGFIPSPKYSDDSYLHPVEIDGQIVNLLDQNNDGKNDVYTQNPDEILEMIERTPLEYTPGSKNVYSDVDYMLLGLIVEQVSGQKFDVFCQEQIFGPLGLTHTVFNPLQNGFNKDQCAATEIFGNTREGHVNFPNIRTEVVQGEVHDEKAYYSMGGVAGHAGLFSNAGDLAVLMQVMLNGGGYGNVELFDQKTIDTFTAPSKTNDTYGLGWRRQGNGAYAWSFGDQAPDSTIGHTGWTGTATSIDKENDLIIVWLTNTKNTPIADPAKDVNRMEGDAFQFDAAGTLSTLVYEGIIGTSEEALEESLLQMSLDRSSFLKEAIEKDKNCTEADYKATVALADVLVKKAEKEKDNKEVLRRAKLAYEALPDHSLKEALGERLSKLND